MVVKKNPTPLNLFNIYGDDGDKYIVGGIFIRRAKGWTVSGRTFSDEGTMSMTTAETANMAASMSEMSAKIAALDCKNLALLRARIPNLIVPLSCIIDYYGLRFET